MAEGKAMSVADIPCMNRGSGASKFRASKFALKFMLTIYLYLK
jgi:hypothetical protein